MSYARAIVDRATGPNTVETVHEGTRPWKDSTYQGCGVGREDVRIGPDGDIESVERPDASDCYLSSSQVARRYSLSATDDQAGTLPTCCS